MAPNDSGAERVRDRIDGAEEMIPELPRPLMRQLPSAEPFPVDSLGDHLAPAARAIHDRVQAPLAICGQAVLAAATLATQSLADVRLPTGQERPLTNFLLTIAASGERKTAADREAHWPIRKREEALREKFDNEIADFLNSKAAWDRARDKAIKKGIDQCSIKASLDALGPPPRSPLNPLLTCTEPTYEGLCKLFADGYPSLGIFSTEGGQFIGGHGMSQEAKLRTAAGLSCLWDGDAIKRVRSGDGAICLPGRRLAMHLQMQPDVANALLADRLLKDQGLLSRMLVTAPDGASGSRPWRDPLPQSDCTLKRYSAHLLSILEHPLPLVLHTSNTLAPRPIGLSHVATQQWIGFYNHIESRVRNGAELASVRAFANKLPEHAARIAAVLTIVADIDATEISRNEMEAGILLAQHYAAESLRLEGAGRISEILRIAQVLLAWLHSRGEPLISLPDIYQLGPEQIRDKQTATCIVQILEDHEWLVRVPRGAIIAGKNRRDVWRVVQG